MKSIVMTVFYKVLSSNQQTKHLIQSVGIRAGFTKGKVFEENLWK